MIDLLPKVLEYKIRDHIDRVPDPADTDSISLEVTGRKTFTPAEP